MSYAQGTDVIDDVLDYFLEIWYSANLYGIHLGWFLLAGVLLLLYFWPQLQRKLDSSYKKHEAQEYDAKCKKNPDWVRKQEDAMNVARQRMQEELTRKAKEHEEKMKEREEKQKQERLAVLNNDVGGHTLGSSDDKKNKNRFKPEYHPLMGSGSSNSYRPPRRSCCPSGGCG